jgi:hypothetical protein
MALSPNYSWAEPDNSSLVKNGAQDIRALGDAIDTSVWNIGFGQAGKNKIINGDFGIWQRGTTFNSIATGTYTADRWSGAFINGTCNVTQQAFTAGTAPVAGYESQYFLRFARTSTAGTADFFNQKIEDVRTFAGQTATISFWAKCSTASANGIIFYLSQNFGSGGSSAIDISPSTTTGSVTTSWTRYSASFTVPSIAGKTIGASNFLAMVFQFPTAHGNVSFDIWGVQVEYGSKATPFETATGTIQGELGACQFYYERVGGTDVYATFGTGIGQSATAVRIITPYKVTKRVTPTAIDFSTLQVNDGTTIIAVTSVTLAASSINKDFGALDVVVASGGTQYRPYVLGSNNSASAFLGFSAEL